MLLVTQRLTASGTTLYTMSARPASLTSQDLLVVRGELPTVNMRFPLTLIIYSPTHLWLQNGAQTLIISLSILYPTGDRTLQNSSDASYCVTTKPLIHALVLLIRIGPIPPRYDQSLSSDHAISAYDGSARGCLSQLPYIEVIRSEHLTTPRANDTNFSASEARPQAKQ